MEIIGGQKTINRSIPLNIHEFSDISKMEKELVKEDKSKIVKLEMQKLVAKYGICMALDALKNEAARLVLCEYCPDAVKIHDVLRAAQEEICEKPLD
jgi:hypothetical protein